MKTKDSLAILAIFLCPQFAMHAQLILPKALEKPIELALKKDHSLTNKQLEVDKVKAQKMQAIANYIPTIEATGGYAYFNNDLVMDIPTVTLPNTGTQLFEDKTKFSNKGNILHGGIMAKTVLFSGMQVEMGAKALQAKSQADELLMGSERDSLVLEVVNSFDLLRYIQASKQLLEESDVRLEKEELRVNKGIENGLAIPFDRDKIKLARLTLEAKRTELNGVEQLLYQKIEFLTGLSEEESKQIAYELDPILLPKSMSVDDKQELQALESYHNATKYLLRKEQFGFLPQIIAFGGVNYSGFLKTDVHTNPNYLQGVIPQLDFRVSELSLSPNWMVGIGLKWDLFSMNKIYRIKQAKMAMEQIDNKAQEGKEKLNLLLQKKKVEEEVKMNQILIADQQQKVAENSLTSAESQYRNGMISVTDRLAAENDFIQMNQQRVKAIVDQRKAAMEAVKVTGNLVQKIEYK